jgi:hypothetical protein
VSWIRKHPVLAIAALAFAARASCAVVTEFKPLFPDYYYTDARITNKEALARLAAVRDGLPPRLAGPLNHKLHVLMTFDVYRALGPRQFAVKLLNSALGAAGVAALVIAFEFVFAGPAALAAGAAISVWPSHIFYTSQNLKESPTHALAFAGFAAALCLGLRPPTAGARRWALAALAVGGLIGGGFFRSYVLLGLSGALCAAFAFAAASGKPRGRALAALAVAASTLALYPLASQRLFALLQTPGEEAAMTPQDSARVRPSLMPETIPLDGDQPAYRPTSPQGLSGFRHTRQDADRYWAKINAHREIGTQIFPDADFRTWGDVFAYLPKGAFYVLFMPLPGLYPLDGKLGRLAASAENIVLLALACLAAAGICRGPKTAGRAVFLLYFAAMATGAALLEFDLGSAGRHKLLYLPMLFPFAAEEIFRLLGRKEPS